MSAVSVSTNLAGSFENQVGLMQTLGIYRKVNGTAADLNGIPDDAVVKDLLEPVASPPGSILRWLSTAQDASDISTDRSPWREPALSYPEAD